MPRLSAFLPMLRCASSVLSRTSVRVVRAVLDYGTRLRRFERPGRPFYVGLVCACLILGCSGGAKDELIPLEQLPDGLLKTAQEKLPEVKFENALKRGDGTYEVRGKDKKGKVRDVEMSATGEVLEVE